MQISDVGSLCQIHSGFKLLYFMQLNTGIVPGFKEWDRIRGADAKVTQGKIFYFFNSINVICQIQPPCKAYLLHNWKIVSGLPSSSDFVWISSQIQLFSVPVHGRKLHFCIHFTKPLALERPVKSSSAPEGSVNIAMGGSTEDLTQDRTQRKVPWTILLQQPSAAFANFSLGEFLSPILIASHCLPALKGVLPGAQSIYLLWTPSDTSQKIQNWIGS